MFDFPRNPTSRQLRQFAAIGLPLAVVVLAGLLWRGVEAPVVAVATLVVGGAVSVAGLWRPAMVRPLFLAWMAAVWPMSWLLGCLFLMVAYFLVITPVGWMLRLWGHDPLSRRLDRNAQTYWKPANNEDNRERYFRQF